MSAVRHGAGDPDAPHVDDELLRMRQLRGAVVGSAQLAPRHAAADRMFQPRLSHPKSCVFRTDVHRCFRLHDPYGCATALCGLLMATRGQAARVSPRYCHKEKSRHVSRTRKVKRSAQAHMPGLDAEIMAMLDRVRQVFGDEVLGGIYERAQNAAIRQSVSPDAATANASNDGQLRVVSDSTDDGFVRALRDELDRVLTHH